MSDVREMDGQPSSIEPELPWTWATVQEAARQLDVPVTFLRREVKAGRVPSIRMGRSDRVNVRAVKAALERQAAGEYADSLFGTLGTPFVLPSGDGETIPPEVPVGVWGGSGGPRYQP